MSMVVINTEKLPIKIWIDQNMWESTDLPKKFDNAIQQAKNLANHPLARKYICLMPDFHVGYGMPIGGVLATQGGVVPNAVGVDIGCGMVAVKTSLQAGDLSKEFLQNLRLKIHQKIPVGQNHHQEAQHHPLLERRSMRRQQLTGLYTQEVDPVLSDLLGSADKQIGTLGGGNHFIEIQKDQNNQVWIMIHSGSRNLGKRVCDYYHKKAKDYMEAFHVNLPDNDLAFLPVEVKEHDMYLKAMRFCMEFAEASRELMLKRVGESLIELGKDFILTEKFDTHHNFAAMENHFGQNLMIHRKGAVKAQGKLTIPGSMGTVSYICEGLEPKESFNTCSHGAGRMMGRKEANALIKHEEAVEMMKDVVFGIKNGDYDEMPIAYKDIEQVIKDQSDLVKPIYKLTPLAVCKG